LDALKETSRQSPPSSEAAGRFNGKSVSVVSNPTTFVQDALEEIGMARANDRSFSKRRLEPSKRASQVGEELAEEYLRSQKTASTGAVDHSENMFVLLDEFETLKLDEKEVKQHVLRYLVENDSEDPYKQFASLVNLKNILDSGSGQFGSTPYKLHQIELLLSSLYSEHGEAIRAGFNVSSYALEISKSSESTLVDLYITTVLNVDSLSDLHKSLVKRSARSQYSESIEFLIGAVGKDFSASVSSTDEVKLKSALSSLKRLQVLQTIKSRCYDMAARLEAALKESVNDEVIYEKIIELLELSYPLSRNIVRAYESLVIDEPQFNVWIHNEMYGAINSIPHHVFPDDSSREVLFEALDEAMEQVVEIEEREGEESNEKE